MRPGETGADRRIGSRPARQALLLWACVATASTLSPAVAVASKLAPRVRIDRGLAAIRTAAAGVGAPAPTYEVLIQVASGVTIDAMRRAYPQGGFRVAAGPVITATVSDALLDALDADPRVLRVEASRKLHPTLDVVRSNTSSAGLYLGVTRNAAAADLANANGAGVIVGVIDSGIDFRHKDFIVPGTNTSRILYIWDQTDTGGPAPSFPGFSCTNSGFENDCTSTEWSQAQISAALAGSGTVREYDSGGHGTHVAGIAAGNGQGGSSPGTYVGIAPKASIIFVKTDFTNAGIVDALQYIAARASLLGMPAVVNISIGGQIDPHDGTSPFDVAVANVAANTPVVVAMGNDGTAAGAAPHAQVSSFAHNAAVTFQIQVYGGHVAAVADFWTGSPSIASNATFTASVAVNGTNCGTEADGSGTDNGVTSTPFNCAGQQVYLDNDNVAVGLSGNDTSIANDREIYADVYNASGLPSLTFTVTLTCTSASGCGQLDGFVDPEIEGVNFLTGAGYSVPASMTLSSPGTANNVIAVASYATKTSWKGSDGGTYTYDNSTLGMISTFSGWGPSRDGRQKPDVAAPGDVVASSLSEQAANCSTCTVQDTPGVFDQYLSDGAHAILAGTSMATPVVTGIVATRLQGVPTRTPAQLRAILQGLARSDGAVTTAPTYYNGSSFYQNGWNVAFGAGKATASPQPVSPPTGVAGAVLGSSSVTWTWNGSLLSADAFDVYYGSNTSSALALAVQPPFTQTGMSANTAYTVQVDGEGGGIDGPAASAASVVTLANPPAGISYAEVTNSITATFTPLPSSPPSATCLGYVLQASTSPDFTTVVWSSAAGTAQSSLTVGGLSLGAAYYVRLGTLNSAGAVNYVYGGQVATQTTPPTAASPSSFTATSMQANFGAGGNPSGTSYVVDAAAAPDFSGQLHTVQSSSLYAIVTGLQPNTIYYLRVRAVTASGVGSAEVSDGVGATLANPPAAGSPPLQSIAFSSFTAQWTPYPASPQQSTAEGMRVDASTAPDFSGNVFSNSVSGVSASTLTITGLTQFTSYYVRVGSLNWSGLPNYTYYGSILTLLTVNSTQAVPSTGNLNVVVTPTSAEVVKVNVQVPQGAFPLGTNVNVNTSVSSVPGPGPGQTNLTPIGFAMDISAGGLQPSVPVTITVVYNPASLPAGVSPATLTMAYYSPATGFWNTLPTAVDPLGAVVTAQTPHFTLFAPFAVASATSAASDLSSILVSPVPWEPSSGGAYDAPWVTLRNLPAFASVKVYTVQGEKVWDGDATSSGVLQWPGTNSGGRPVGSGTYLAVIQSGSSRAVRRVVVIR